MGFKDCILSMFPKALFAMADCLVLTLPFIIMLDRDEYLYERVGRRGQRDSWGHPPKRRFIFFEMDLFHVLRFPVECFFF